VPDLRIGVLGAARILRGALVRPAARVAGVRVAAIAARDPDRARDAARRHGIPEVHGTYDSLLADPTLDAVYLPLPSALHGEWMLKALAAGKHVLCEKPFAANAEEAERVADAASDTGLVVMEGFHYRYHPLMHRLVEIVRSGDIGELVSVSSSLCIPLPPSGDFRWRAELGGGSTMDVGCYPIHLVRTLAGQEPAVTDAIARASHNGVDRYLRADLRFPSGATGRVTSSMWSLHAVDSSATVRGTRGSIRMLGPFHPHAAHLVVVRDAGGRRVERFTRRPTFDFQLGAFRDAVRDDAAVLTGPADSVATMRVIDGCYRAAGLPPRLPHAQSRADDAPAP